MARTLDVYLHRDQVGTLVQNKHGDVVFEYHPDWLANPNAKPLSQSLPLRAKRFNQREGRPFFAGILPEEGKRELIARNLAISARNDFAMLERIGGECAGAVTFLPTGTPLPAHDDSYRALSESELANILRTLPRRTDAPRTARSRKRVIWIYGERTSVGTSSGRGLGFLLSCV